MAEAYIVEAVRTAGGRARKGGLIDVHPADMGATILNALVDRTGVDPAAIDDVIVGCVSQAGEQAFALGRNLVLASKLPDSVPAVTIDRQCGSSQQALHFAAQAIMSGTQDLVIAAGAESMTRVPMGSNYKLHAAAGVGIGPWPKSIQNRYGVAEFSQFHGAQAVANKYGFTREEMDAYALASHAKAAAAIDNGAFKAEIVGVETPEGLFDIDDGVRRGGTMEAMASVKTLEEGGTITAANASQMTDGASGVLVASEAAIKRFNLKPMARIVNLTVTAGDPVIMLEEPIPATRRAFERSGLSLNDIDLFEVNEAFASVVLRFMQAFDVDNARVNVNGGAIAMGHPLGATGAMIIGTLLDELERTGKGVGLATLCIGSGMGAATIIERV